MSAEHDDPRDPDETPDENDQPGAGGERTPDAPRDAPSTPRIPPEDATALEQKRFIVVRDLSDAPLTVSVADGDVAADYAPGDLIGKLAEKVSALLKELGGGLTPMLYGVAPGHSMVLVFGDPPPPDAQGQLVIENVLPHARRVAELIDLEDDDLYKQAIAIGKPVAKYLDLAHFVQGESVTLGWNVRNEPRRRLDPPRAQRHYARLTREPPKMERPLSINGTLYRVIAEPRDDSLGTIGVRLHSWSALPPGYGKGARVIASYERPEVEQKIRDGLLNQPVEVTLLIRTPQPGASIDPDRRELIVEDLALGADEHDRLGPRLIEEDEAL